MLVAGIGIRRKRKIFPVSSTTARRVLESAWLVGILLNAATKTIFGLPSSGATMHYCCYPYSLMAVIPYDSQSASQKLDVSPPFQDLPLVEMFERTDTRYYHPSFQSQDIPDSSVDHECAQAYWRANRDNHPKPEPCKHWSF
ncbi:hypothetical protein BT96DRAFT_1014175 [Gymnopus androsaceus JB14]|uniref:Uncharacterized protein n=1 Tax=Gymnopus androsaceus JB14 TaxID=1447944 RepID=A0A6A4IES6_9AGAR|nr:hypothetical protein BT96DRAFT_1014175 [Gymnopus androsaceus JB14]